MTPSPFAHVATGDLSDTLLQLALMAPAGSVKGSLAFAATLLTGRGNPQSSLPDLLTRVQDIRDTLAARFMAGDASHELTTTLRYLNESLTLLRASLALPPLQARLA